MNKKLVIYAGPKARAIVREEGLLPERVRVVAGAAGGPKWLILYGLDRFLFGDFFRGRQSPLHLVGSSIGTWRFAVVSADNDPLSALERFKNAYIAQCYSERPGPAEVSGVAEKILAEVISDDQCARLLSHPCFRLNALTVRETGPVVLRRGRRRQLASLGLAAVGNALSRRALRLFFERVIFHHPDDERFPAGLSDFPTRAVPLDMDNIRQAIVASGSIPMIMAGVRDIPGAPRGAYRDGGIIDYHLNLPFPCDPDGLVLFPHYTDRMVPGWFDKKLPWRRPRPDFLDNVLQVAPHPDFTAILPYGKIPDRQDFLSFRGRDQSRFAYWETVADKSRELAEALQDAIASGRIRDMIRPFPYAHR